MILPYLHERRVYLNRKKDNTNYFYTSINTSLKAEEEHNKMVEEINNQETAKTTLINNNMELNEILHNYNRDQDEIEDGAVSIICMNLSEAKYYIYDTNGILQNRVNYE